MNNFKQFNINPISKGFDGEKIKIAKILNREIIVNGYKIEDSKCFKERGTGKCLYLHISFKKENRIIFTGSGVLINEIQRVPKDGFPFTTIIIQENERFMFT